MLGFSWFQLIVKVNAVANDMMPFAAPSKAPQSSNRDGPAAIVTQVFILKSLDADLVVAADASVWAKRVADDSLPALAAAGR